MSGASTEPCRGRRIPGLARCRQGQRTLSVGLTAFGRSSRAPAGNEPSTEAMMRGQQPHPSRGARRAPKWVPGHCPGAVPGLVVDVPAVLQLQYVDKVVAVPVVQVVRGLFFLFFDKFVDMPVAAQLQYVDKVVDFPACRSCSSSRCPV